jgi:hypothetical protein
MQHFDYECKTNKLEPTKHVISLGIWVDIDRVDKPGGKERYKQFFGSNYPLDQVIQIKGGYKLFFGSNLLLGRG